jgi:hypothetical protein
MMSANDPDLQPDVSEVLQAEDPAGYDPKVTVCVDGVVRTQALPRKAGATRTVSRVAAAAGLPPAVGTDPLLRADPRRASATIISDKTILIAFTAASAQDAAMMARWPAGVPFRIDTVTAVWVASADATAAVSVITEMWATGDGA